MITCVYLCTTHHVFLLLSMPASSGTCCMRSHSSQQPGEDPGQTCKTRHKCRIQRQTCKCTCRNQDGRCSQNPVSPALGQAWRQEGFLPGQESTLTAVKTATNGRPQSSPGCCRRASPGVAQTAIAHFSCAWLQAELACFCRRHCGDR